MAVLPEIVIQRALTDGIRFLREDPRILDVLFKRLSQVQRDELKKFVAKQPIDFSVNFPRKQALKLPGLVLTLKTEEEAQTFMGNMMGTSSNEENIPSADISNDDLLGSGQHAGTIAPSSGRGKILQGPLNVAATETGNGGDDTRITFDTDSTVELLEFVQSINQSNPGSMDLQVVQGPGAGEVKGMIKITGDSIDIEESFEVQLTDQSVVVVREASACDTIGEPSGIYASSARNLVQKGVNYDVQYQLSIIAGQQDEVLYLYAVTKAVLLSKTSFLEGQGLQAMRISGTDFAPRAEYLPTEAFQRTMILKFVSPFAFLEEIESAGAIDLNLTPEDPTNPDDPCTFAGRIDI